MSWFYSLSPWQILGFSGYAHTWIFELFCPRQGSGQRYVGCSRRRDGWFRTRARSREKWAEVGRRLKALCGLLCKGLGLLRIICIMQAFPPALNCYLSTFGWESLVFFANWFLSYANYTAFVWGLWTSLTALFSSFTVRPIADLWITEPKDNIFIWCQAAKCVLICCTRVEINSVSLIISPFIRGQGNLWWSR